MSCMMTCSYHFILYCKRNKKATQWEKTKNLLSLYKKFRETTQITKPVCALSACKHWFHGIFVKKFVKVNFRNFHTVRHPLIASSKNLWKKKERGRTLGTYLGLLWTMEIGSFLHSVLFFLLRFIICNY